MRVESYMVCSVDVGTNIMIVVIFGGKLKIVEIMMMIAVTVLLVKRAGGQRWW